MRNIIYILLLLLFFTACEKVIDVDLNEADPEVVIEANVSKYPESSIVQLSKTGSYFGESSIEKITGASVVVKDEFNAHFVLDEIEEGIYLTEDLKPLEGVVYELLVEIEGESYEAVSKLNPIVKIDSLTYYFDDGFAFLESGYVVKIHFVDPVDVENYYRIKVFEKDSTQGEYKDYILFDDKFIDGQNVEVALRGYIFDSGAEITIQLITLDKGAYEYYKTFQELINVNPGSAAPANPTSNISNGALGYFSAWTSDVEVIIVGE